MIEVCLLGAGGMMPLPDRYLTSLYARADGRAVLIDCGEGTQTAIREHELRFKCIEAVCLTHYHADHISGLPGLLLTLGNENRTSPLRVYGPKGLVRLMRALRVIVPELPYDIELAELPDETVSFTQSGFEITSFPLDHGMPCKGYALKLNRRGKFDVERAKQKGVPLAMWSRLQAGENAGGFYPEDVLGEPRRGLKLLYATDTRPVRAIAEIGFEADLMVLEGMFGDAEKQQRAEQTRHMTMREAARLAYDARAKALWLTHFSPATPHPEEYTIEIDQVFPGAVMGADGMRATLRFLDE